MNKHCYSIETLYYNSGLYDSAVDATYVISLESYKDRYNSIVSQINKQKPSSVVHIVHNQGYKKCLKVRDCSPPDTFIDNPTKDLTDAYKYIFNDAQIKQYKYILILEDDAKFIYYPNLKSHIKSICDFVNKHKPDLYTLGNFNSSNKSGYHKKINWISPTTAIIYNVDAVTPIFNTDWQCEHETPHVDSQFFSKHFNNKWLYYLPLFTQPFEKTENFNFWCLDWKDPVIKDSCMWSKKYLWEYLLPIMKSKPFLRFYFIFTHYKTHIVITIIILIILLNRHNIARVAKKIPHLKYTKH